MSDANTDGTIPVPPAAPPAAPSHGTPGSYAPPPIPQAPPVAPPYAPAPPYAAAPPAYPTAPTAYGTAPAYSTAPAYGAPYGGYPPAKTNTLAIVSLVASLVGLLMIPLLGSIVGVITGHMSLGQIKRTGEQGRGLALAGTIVGYVGLGFVLLMLIVLFAMLPLIIASVNTSV